MLLSARTFAMLLLAAASPAGSAEQLTTAGRLEVVAPLTQGPGNIAVTPSGRIILSQHQF
jgi:hypothetical protein